MHQIELLVYKFLQDVQKGKALINLKLFSKFGKEAEQALTKQFNEPRSTFYLRMSNIGRPSCQLEFEQAGIPGDSVGIDTVRNTYGDITEKLIMFVLYASGVPIVSEQERVIVKFGEVEIAGTLDLVVDFGNDPRVWDIKSASEWSFKNKFSKSFEDFIKEDFYGYGEQLFGYAEGKRCKVGGWIAFDKSSGKIRVLAAPEDQQSIRETILRRVKDKVDFLARKRLLLVGDGTHEQASEEGTTKLLVDKCFSDSNELYRNVPTGNSVAAIACTMCSWKFKCWPNLQLRPKAKSTAKNPPLVYYTEYNENKKC